MSVMSSFRQWSLRHECGRRLMLAACTPPDAMRSLAPQVQFRALNELQAPAQSGDQLQWLTSSAHVLNVIELSAQNRLACSTHQPAVCNAGHCTGLPPNCLYHRALRLCACRHRVAPWQDTCTGHVFTHMGCCLCRSRRRQAMVS